MASENTRSLLDGLAAILRVVRTRGFSILPRLAPSTLLILLCVLSYPATAQSPIPISDSSQRWEYSGYSVLPPKGEDWFVFRERNPYRGKFAKKPPAERHVIFAVSEIGKLERQDFNTPDEFLQYFKKSEQLGTPPSRFKVVNDRYALLPTIGEYCVRHDVVTEDHGHPSGQDMKMDRHQVMCIHPYSKKGLAVSLTCMQRTLLDAEFIDLAQECEPFLTGVKFNEKTDKN